ncbi:hypothetical protein [Hymenobacter sp. HDW8]|uniref:hypothetical protein n=1 Tax=Hymenobacter sp. HDW8 TaxID=2714932 RepID=UPI00140CEF93|nr:hypothetical protein [Hymenobacter sp. HDW8]QIL78444.1 hypothetical protein G7064_21730 [Hymenobacter sp. HDW8]
MTAFIPLFLNETAAIDLFLGILLIAAVIGAIFLGIYLVNNLAGNDNPSQFRLKLYRFGRRLLIATILYVLAIALANYFN